jgi:hypothetical protein
MQGTASDEQERNNRKSGSDTGSSRQHLPAVAPGTIDTRGTTGSDQGGVEFSRVRIRTRQGSACPLGIGLKRKRIGMAL